MIKQLLTSSKFYLSLFILFLIGTLLLIGFNFFIMPAYTQYHEGLTLPDVTKMPLKKAQSVLTNYGLRYEIAERRANTSYPADYIIDQTPSPNSIVKPDRKVYLTVNTASNPTVIVPDVTNLSLRNAQIQLQNYGLKDGSVSYVSSRFKNSVVRQSIPPGTTVDKGKTVNLTVSDGLGIEKVPIPDIVEVRLPQAQQKLQKVGLRIGQIRFKPSKDFIPNTVLSYSPNDNDSVVVGSKLDLVVSERFNVEEESESGAVNMDSTTVTPPDSIQQNENN